MLTTFEDEIRARGFLQIAGLDEVGRGPLAGPVCAAAVILPEGSEWVGLNDSKKLSAKKRDLLFDQIKEGAISWAVGLISPEKIDEVNILNASFLAMKEAMEQLSVTPDYLLIDGNRFKPYHHNGVTIPHTCYVHGDARFASIAAASILAKTYRDERMVELAKAYPGYRWEVNKGYPTKDHRAAIAELGVTPHHRKTFRLLPDPVLF